MIIAAKKLVRKRTDLQNFLYFLEAAVNGSIHLSTASAMLDFDDEALKSRCRTRKLNSRPNQPHATVHEVIDGAA